MQLDVFSRSCPTESPHQELIHREPQCRTHGRALDRQSHQLRQFSYQQARNEALAIRVRAAPRQVPLILRPRRRRLLFLSHTVNPVSQNFWRHPGKLHTRCCEPETTKQLASWHETCSITIAASASIRYRTIGGEHGGRNAKGLANYVLR